MPEFALLDANVCAKIGGIFGIKKHQSPGVAPRTGTIARKAKQE